MALQTAPQLAQRQQFLAREVARMREHGVERRRGMAFSQDEAIARFVVGILGVVLEDASKVQRA